MIAKGRALGDVNKIIFENPANEQKEKKITNDLYMWPGLPGRWHFRTAELRTRRLGPPN